MNTVNTFEYDVNDARNEQLEQASGTFSIAILMSAIAFATLVMALSIVAAAQSVHV